MLDVCICTHNPRADILKVVINSVAAQTADPESFQVVLVDNASFPPIDKEILNPLQSEGIRARIVREDKPGIARARVRAARETCGDWILFVDDDNELAPNYIEEGYKFIFSQENIGCFGGKLLLPENIQPPAWVKPFLPYLAIKDVGDELIMGGSSDWGIWEPPTAGAFIRRALLNEYCARSEVNAMLFKLGRQGTKNLASCEDSLIMRTAFHLGLKNAYNPRLVLYHHLDNKRFKLGYLIRLMYAYGISHVVLEALLKGTQPMPIITVTSDHLVSYCFR